VLRPQLIDLNDVVEGMATMLGRMLGADVLLSTELDPGLGLTLADPTQLEQVVLNLAINARDAMPDGGGLVLRTERLELGEDDELPHPDLAPGGYVTLVVRDTGTGLDPSLAEQIFEPFFTTKDVGKGTGLGLSSVYGIVKQAEGYVWAYSELGVGTTFKLYFPRAEASSFAAVIPLPVSGGSEMVLVAEDEAHVRAVVVRTLLANGYQTLEASDGKDAVEVLRAYTGPVHLLLTDVAMPRMGGLELAEAAGQLRPELPVLFMSGYPHRDSEPSELDGARERHFLDKPFSPADLLRKVREVLDGQTVPAGAHSGR
jgi:two-component system cell cycle sensor histidine kinase/response regulator CckA